MNFVHGDSNFNAHQILCMRKIFMFFYKSYELCFPNVNIHEFLVQ